MKRSSVILLGILIFAIVATPLILTSSADSTHSKAGKFLIPPDIVPPINTAKHVIVPVHHIFVHPATQVPVIGQSPVKSQVDVDWSCGSDDSKKGNSGNKCDSSKKDLMDKSNNGKSQDNFSDGFGNETNHQDNSDDVNTTEVSANDDSNESRVPITVK